MDSQIIDNNLCNTHYINFKTDFLFFLKFEELRITTYPWNVVFFTVHDDGKSSPNTFEASFDGKIFKNCHLSDAEDDVIVFEFTKHELPCGRLFYDANWMVANPMFSTGIQNKNFKIPTEFKLWEGPNEETEIASEVFAQMLKGDPGHTPIKGVDYFTPAEVGQVAAEAAGLVPVPDVSEVVDASIHASALCFDRTQEITASQQTTARTNASSVGYLCLSASQGPESDNYALTLRSTLSEVQAAYSLFRTAPGRSRWSLSVYEPGEQNPFIEEAELEPLQVNGGLELQFTSKRSGRRYAVVLTVADFVVTAVRVEYCMRPELRGCVEAGAVFNTQTGYWEYYDLTDLTDEQVGEMYARWIRSGHISWAYNNNKTLRATFAPLAYGYNARCEVYFAFSNSNIEIACIPGNILSADRCFYNCLKLRQVHAISMMSGSIQDFIAAERLDAYGGTTVFYMCRNMEWVMMRNIRANLSFGNSPNLKQECVVFMVLNATPTSAITLTFHQAVYAQITDELKATAATKNITLASA